MRQIKRAILQNVHLNSMEGPGQTGAAKLKALACLSHKRGVRPPCSLLPRLWSVTAKYCKPLATTAVAIVLTEALPSGPWRYANASRT